MGHALSRLRKGRRQERSGDDDYTKDYSYESSDCLMASSPGPQASPKATLNRGPIEERLLELEYQPFRPLDLTLLDAKLHPDPFESSLVKETGTAKVKEPHVKQASTISLDSIVPSLPSSPPPPSPPLLSGRTIEKRERLLLSHSRRSLRRLLRSSPPSPTYANPLKICLVEETDSSKIAMRENPPSRYTRISSNIVTNREDKVFNIGPSVTLACPPGALDSRLRTLSITVHLDDPSKYYGLIVRRDLENDVMFGAPVINIEPTGHYFKKPLTLATKVESRFSCHDVFILHGFKAREGNITWHDITHNSRIDEANAGVDIEIYHFSLIAILLRLGRSTLLCTKDIVTRLNLVPFNYTLSVLLKSNPSSVHDELALLFVSQDVYCEQFYREDETSSALMLLKKEGFKELHVRSVASEEEKSIYNNETLQINIHLGEDYKLANKEQESICLTVNSYDWWHEGKVMRIPLEWKKNVRSLCGKVSVTGQYGHTSERHFRERELCGYVRNLLGVEGVIFNVIPIAHLLGIPEESINQIAKSQNDEDEDLEMILEDWSKERDFVDNLAVLRKSLESLKQKDIKVTERGQMYIRHVRKLASKISGLQCMNADSQSYFIHKIQALCKSVFRDCCIELESYSDDVERAASFTNHAEYLIQSMEILSPIPEDIAEKYHQLLAESSQESIIKTFIVIVPFLIQNIKDIFIEDRMSEVPQNGLRGLPKDKLGNFVSAVRNAEENDNLPQLVCEFCNILEQLCTANYDRNQPITEFEKWSKSLAVLPMLNFLKSFFQYCPQDIRLHKRLDLFSCSIKDIMANRDKIDDFSVRDLSNVLLSLIHFAKFDPSKLVRFELSDSENVPLSCSREGVKYNQFDNTYSELFRIKKQSNDELHLHAFARVYVNGDTYSKGTFQSTAMLAASSKNALKECVTCYHDVTVVMTEVKGSGNLRVVFFAAQKEKLLELLDVLIKELREHVVHLNRSEVTQCPLSMRSVTSKTDAVLSLRLVYEWGSEAVFLDSKDFVMSSPSTCHVPRGDEIQISIKMMDDTLATIAVNPSDSISSVKKKIHRLCKCPSDQLRLVFAGKKLEDDLTLNHYNVQNKSTLHLVQRLRAVARNPRRDANGNDAER